MAHVEKRGTKWRAGYWAGTKRITRTFDRRADALTWARDGERSLTIGTHVDPSASRITVAEWSRLWLDAWTVEHTTLAIDTQRVSKHIIPTFGAVAIGAITPLRVQSWVRQLGDAGLAGDSVRRCHRLLSLMLAAAVAQRILSINPAAATKLPPRGVGREVFWTRREVELIEAECGRWRGAIVRVAARTGMRWGELAGLHVGDVHPARREIEVRRVITQVGKTFRLKPYPKGRKRRSLPVTQDVIDVIADVLSSRPPSPCGLDHPRGETCSLLVFSRPLGGPLSRHWFARDVFARAVRAAGVTPGTPHDLRHSYASWLIGAGVDVVTVAHLLGHADIRTTQRYAHLAPGHGDAVRAVLASPVRAIQSGVTCADT